MIETRYTISAQYMLVNGEGRGDILLYRNDKSQGARIVEDCIRIDIKLGIYGKHKGIRLIGSEEDVIKKLSYGYDVTSDDLRYILEAVRDNIVSSGLNDITVARTVTREVVKRYEQVDRISVHVNVNNCSSKMLLICYCGEEKKNEYNVRIYRGDICADVHNNWNGNYSFQMNDLPKEVKNVIVEKIDSLMKEMDEIKEPIFSINREFAL